MYYDVKLAVLMIMTISGSDRMAIVVVHTTVILNL